MDGLTIFVDFRDFHRTAKDRPIPFFWHLLNPKAAPVAIGHASVIFSPANRRLSQPVSVGISIAV
ncbi:MAG TPA: hypothetical protein VNE82_10435 [Candidatus Binataceae bacterium]|nr:hypothetical protein [Candidatus Binataceae bacterium]